MCGGSGKSDGGMDREGSRATSQLPVGYMVYVRVCSRHVRLCACESV